MLHCNIVPVIEIPMQPFKLSAEATTAMTGLATTAGRNSSRHGELARAAAEVVMRRMALGGFAVVDPANADHGEFARMMPEKTRAFADAGAVLVNHSNQIGQEVARFMAAEAALLGQTAATILASPGPAGIMAAQMAAASAWFGRLATQSSAICLLALEAQGAVLAPIHRAATDNAERLRI
jgi:hypothetical protein